MRKVLPIFIETDWLIAKQKMGNKKNEKGRRR